MKHYNPVALTLNMPCQYIESADGSSQVLTGHFAFFDSTGTPYVWREGGTSYTRASAFNGIQKTIDHYIENNPDAVQKCQEVFPLSKHAHSSYKHEEIARLKNTTSDIIYTFEQFIQYGIDNGANIVNGMPWSFNFHGAAVTHSDDNTYLISAPVGKTTRDITYQRGWKIILQTSGQISIRKGE